MSIKAISWAMRLPVRGPARKLTLLCLADYSGDKGISHPTIETLKASTSMGEAAIQKELLGLIQDGIITELPELVLGNRVFQLNPIKEQDVKPKEKKLRLPKDEASAEALQVYAVYPRRINKRKALGYIMRGIKQYGFPVVMDGTQKFADAWKASGKATEYCPHDTTFFGNDRYTNEPEAWGLSGAVKLISGIPSFKQMTEYAREKDPDKDFCAILVSGFMSHWTKRGWKTSSGTACDWKSELANFIGRERTKNQNQQS